MKINKQQILSVAGLSFCLSCANDEPVLPVPDNGEGTLRTVVACPDATPLRIYAYNSDGKLYTEATTPEMATEWNWQALFLPGSYRLVVAGADSSVVRLANTDLLSTALASLLPQAGDTLLPALDRPFYWATSSEVKVVAGEEQKITLGVKDIRRVLRLTVDTGFGFRGLTVNGWLAGISRSVRLTDRALVGAGTLALRFKAVGDRNPGVYQAVAGVLGCTAGAEEGNILTLRLQSTAETYGFRKDLTQALCEALATGRDTLDVHLDAVPFVPISLFTSIQTRASMDVFQQTPVALAVGSASGQYTDNWEGMATGNRIDLRPERYYPADGSSLYLRSYYPVAPIIGGEVHYTLTGQEDLLLSVERSGSLSGRFDGTATPLTHRHLLSQLSFRLQITGAPKGYTVQALSLNGLASEARVSLARGEVVSGGKEVSVVVYAAAGGEGIPVVDGVVTLPGLILVQPQATLTLDLTLSPKDDPANGHTFKNVPISFDGGGNTSGGAYHIDISLQLPDDPVDPDEPDQPDTPDPPVPPVDPEDPLKSYLIQIKAAVTPWKTGNNGNADL